MALSWGSFEELAAKISWFSALDGLSARLDVRAMGWFTFASCQVFTCVVLRYAFSRVFRSMAIIRRDEPYIDLALVGLHVRTDAASVPNVFSTVTLLYGESTVCQWRGLHDAKTDAEVKSGVYDAQLSQDKATLTLFSWDGHLKLSVPEIVEGWMLGTGSPEPPTILKSGSKPNRRVRQEISHSSKVDTMSMRAALALMVENMEAQPAKADIDWTSVDIDFRKEDDETGQVLYFATLYYGESVVSQWYGRWDTNPDNEFQSGIHDAQLSQDKATLTLHSGDGLLKISVPEILEGWMLGAGCPEPAGSLQKGSRCKRKRQQSSTDAISMRAALDIMEEQLRSDEVPGNLKADDETSKSLDFEEPFAPDEAVLRVASPIRSQRSNAHTS